MTDQSQTPAAAPPVYARLAVIGGGLIGGSVIRAARSHGAAGEIVVADAKPEHRARLQELGVADAVFADPAEAAKGADLIVLAVPVMAMGEATAAAAPGMQPGATLTDVGSVKGAVA
ncbi:MAG TPA: prephenate dehydrogenase/arogenate dehydrogenase family protein, partial [Caulobacteraceae bacterium]|nr:prephenate dehydrogenase/arogenate dehydrogenase family protein [Caulobacteraceae bacterium]